MKNEKIGIIGIGKLGLCFGLNLSKVGWDIVGVDKNEAYIDLLKKNKLKSDEEYVNEYLNKYPFEYSTDIEEALKCNIIFVVVETPSTSDFKYDHSTIENIKEKLISFGTQESRKDIVINCTTFPGYCDTLHAELKELNYHVSYNPEFIAQGTIIRDQVYCDNVLIGGADQYAEDKIAKIHKSFALSNPIINKMSRTEAEITKIASNCFLTTKISFANMIGDIAKGYNCSGEKILDAIGTDSRIGTKYLKPGFGFGGPCFPRDNRALAKCGEEVGVRAEISIATDKMNKLHLEYQIDHIVKNISPDEVIEMDYLTYKKESTSLEESQQLEFAKILTKKGYKIKINDDRKEVINEIEKKHGIKFT